MKTSALKACQSKPSCHKQFSMHLRLEVGDLLFEMTSQTLFAKCTHATRLPPRSLFENAFPTPVQPTDSKQTPSLDLIQDWNCFAVSNLVELRNVFLSVATKQPSKPMCATGECWEGFTEPTPRLASSCLFYQLHKYYSKYLLFIMSYESTPYLKEQIFIYVSVIHYWEVWSACWLKVEIFTRESGVRFSSMPRLSRMSRKSFLTCKIHLSREEMLIDACQVRNKQCFNIVTC